MENQYLTGHSANGRGIPSPIPSDSKTRKTIIPRILVQKEDRFWLQHERPEFNAMGDDKSHGKASNSIQGERNNKNRRNYHENSRNDHTKGRDHQEDLCDCHRSVVSIHNLRGHIVSFKKLIRLKLRFFPTYQLKQNIHTQQRHGQNTQMNIGVLRDIERQKIGAQGNESAGCFQKMKVSIVGEKSNHPIWKNCFLVTHYETLKSLFISTLIVPFFNHYTNEKGVFFFGFYAFSNIKQEVHHG